MNLWILALLVGAAGFVGGVSNAVYIRNRSLLDEDQATLAGVEPTSKTEAAATYLVNGFLGAVAACVSWAALSGAVASAATNISTPGVLTTLAGAFSVGLGGTKWLQSERDKGRWQAVTSQVSVSRPNPGLQATLSLASSDEAVQIAKAALGPGRGGLEPTGVGREVRQPSSGSAGGQGGAGARGGGQVGARTPNQPRGAAANVGGATAGGQGGAGVTGGGQGMPGTQGRQGGQGMTRIPTQAPGEAAGSGGRQGGTRIPTQPRGPAAGAGGGQKGQGYPTSLGG